MNTFRAIALAGLSCLLWSPLPSLAGDLVIGDGDYTLVRSKRISRTVYENTYKADVSNWGTTDVNIIASLTSAAPQITVVEGGLSFGDVPVGATMESSDTFTVRHDRSQPFDNAALVWAIQATPLPPTTFELINKALNDELIDAETALVYRVFDEFNDGRLPVQYRGRDDGFFEATAIKEARELFNTLSSATQQLLAPFLFIPDVFEIPPGTPQSATSAGATIAAVPSSTMNNPGQPTVRAAAVPTNLSFIWAVQDVVSIAWENDNPATEAYLEEWAVKSAAEINTIIWPKLTGLFGKPAPDKAVGIILSPTELKRSEETSEDCTIAKIRLANQDVTTLAHELTHALVDLNYPEKCNSNDTLWLHEATANWAMHFVYPKNNREHGSAPSFLGRPEVELEKYERSTEDKPGPEHQYGAYLWFLYITRGDDSGAHYVRETWDAIFNHDSLGAIEAAIGRSLGGFRVEWPQFVLYNWNQKKIIVYGVGEGGEPYRYYAKWDKLKTHAKEETPIPALKVRLNGMASATYPLDFVIPHLAARYFHYDFKTDTSIRSLTLTHPYADGNKPNARVQAIVKIRDQPWKPAEDWTGFSQTTLCLDKPTEDVEELVIVISNSEFRDRTHSSDLRNVFDGPNVIDDPTELKVSALGCSPWIGTVDYSRTLDYNNGLDSVKTTETASTTVTFELEFPQSGIQGTYLVTNPIVTWHHIDSRTFGDTQCSGTGTGTGVDSVNPDAQDRLLVKNFPPPIGDGTTFYHTGYGTIDPTPGWFVHYTCVSPLNSSSYDLPVTALHWFQTDEDWLQQPATIDTDGSLVLRGDFSEQHGAVTAGGLEVERWHWNFKQVRRPR